MNEQSPLVLSAFREDLVPANKNKSYQIYKRVRYQSELVTYEINRLIAVVYMNAFEPPTFASDWETSQSSQSEPFFGSNSQSGDSSDDGG